ncbi:MAG TPA: nitrogen regulation protein NR(II) [Burkholderiales bacterium]|jgi:two-component system nitrogen regulation sensor histidine kinase GlnL|nr:nitrogen regulation protein NR(II) [Burkholderiales bacterium]
MATHAFQGLDLLATAVMLLDDAGLVRYMNPSAENLFGLSTRNAEGTQVDALLRSGVLTAAIGYARDNNSSYSEHDLTVTTYGYGMLHLSCTVTPVESCEDVPQGGFLIEFRHIEQQLKIAREERLLDQSQANRELIRNLAHEIKNPLGGIRGAAQLLDRELERPALHEYTQVIMKEADRLQLLMDRLLTPHRLPQPSQVNIHEVLERVRSVILAEFPGISVRRDYDTSLPTFEGDREQLIQATLNVARNAAQAIASQPPSADKGEIRLRTRVARQVTLARKRYRHAIEVRIIDNGPGIPDTLIERVFYPLVSGREGGSGLGLTLAQNFISQHHGTVTFESEPGKTTFSILLPIQDRDEG